MEQDRAPDVLPHHGELARSAVGEPRGGGQPDWPHDDEDGVGDSVRTGREQLSNRSRSHGAATGEPRYQAGQVPRRMELYHPAKDINGQFILASCLSSTRCRRSPVPRPASRGWCPRIATGRRRPGTCSTRKNTSVSTVPFRPAYTPTP